MLSAASLFHYSISVSSLLLLKLVRSQETPSIHLLNETSSVRQNFCSLHELVENGLIKRNRALRNTHLNVGIFYRHLNGNTGAIDEMNPGISIRILDEIAKRANFTWRESYGAIMEPNFNQTLDDVLYQSVDQYDLVGDWHLRTTQRLNDGVIFPEGWYDGSLIMIRKKYNRVDQFVFFSYFYPFHYYVWILIAVTIIMAGITYYIVEYIESRRTGNKMEYSLGQSISSAAFYIAGHFEHNPNTTSTRLLAFSLIFFFQVIIATYTSSLATFLVTKSKEYIIIKDIRDGIRNDLSFCVLEGSTADTYLSTNFPTSKRILKSSVLETYNAVENEECDVLLDIVGTWETNRLSSEYNRKCNLEWVGRVVEYNSAGFTLRDSERLCTSLLRDVLDYYIIQMKSDGTFNDIWSDFRSNITNIQCPEEEPPTGFGEPIKVKNVAGLFITHGAIMILLLIYSFAKNCSSSGRHDATRTLSITSSQVMKLHKVQSELNQEIDEPTPNGKCLDETIGDECLDETLQHAEDKMEWGAPPKPMTAGDRMEKIQYILDELLELKKDLTTIAEKRLQRKKLL